METVPVTTYSRAPEVEEVGDRLVEEYHPHLRNETIRWIFRDKHALSKGKVVLVHPRKVSGLAGWLHQGYLRDEPPSFTDLFVVEVPRDMWDVLDEKARVALVDHALCHFDVEIPDQGDKDRRLLVRAPDVAEFNVIVERHGLWRPALEAFLKAGSQLTLDADFAAPDPATPEFVAPEA